MGAFVIFGSPKEYLNSEVLIFRSSPSLFSALPPARLPLEHLPRQIPRTLWHQSVEQTALTLPWTVMARHDDPWLFCIFLCACVWLCRWVFRGNSTKINQASLNLQISRSSDVAPQMNPNFRIRSSSLTCQNENQVTCHFPWRNAERFFGCWNPMQADCLRKCLELIKNQNLPRNKNYQDESRFI